MRKYPTVTTSDCRKLGFCMTAVRPWFTQHGLDWRTFCREGISARELLKIDDALAHAAVDQARKREKAAK